MDYKTFAIKTILEIDNQVSINTPEEIYAILIGRGFAVLELKEFRELEKIAEDLVLDEAYEAETFEDYFNSEPRFTKEEANAYVKVFMKTVDVEKSFESLLQYLMMKVAFDLPNDKEMQILEDVCSVLPKINKE